MKIAKKNVGGEQQDLKKGRKVVIKGSGHQGKTFSEIDQRSE